LEASAITEGPLFRAVVGAQISAERLSDRTVALAVKRHLPRGKNVAKFAGHSLRAGFVTSAACGGASVKAIMRQTGHKVLQTNGGRCGDRTCDLLLVRQAL
jgi:site-specific recombinase XerD